MNGDRGPSCWQGQKGSESLIKYHLKFDVLLLVYAEEVVLPVGLGTFLVLRWFQVPMSIENLRPIAFQKVEASLQALNGLADGWGFVRVNKEVHDQLSLRDLLQQ